MTISPLDHPWLSALLGDDELARHFSSEAEHEQIIAFEQALAAATGAEGLIPSDSYAYIAAHISSFVADDVAIAAATARDGVVIPEFIRQLREHLGPHGQYIHLGATSQDVLDTSLVRRLRPVLTEFGGRLRKLQAALDQLDQRWGFVPLMARTRMQDAVPIRASHRIATWRAPLQRHLDRLAELTPRLLVLQFGGAAGTLDKLGDKGPAVAARLAAALDLGLVPQWQSQRDNLADLASWLSLVSGSLGKLGADVALMTQMGEVSLSGAGTSSAMPHKQNPVAAEILVTLARYNGTLVGGMHDALVHEQERSGAAWTLEWLVLPQMVMITAASLRTALALAAQLTRLGKA